METVLITGASSGMGYEYAKIFSEKGYRCILVARREEKLKKIANDLQISNPKSQIQYIVLDLSLSDAASVLYEKLKQRNINVDILINNAGFGEYGSFIESDRERQLNMIALNCLSVISLTHTFLNGMLSRGHGKILNVASVAAFQPGPFMAVYFATKSFVLSFSEALSYELSGSGVTVTVLCPGATSTEFNKTEDPNKSIPGFKNSLASAESVASFGYNSLMKGSSVAVYGIKNQLSVFLIRFLPRKVVLFFVAKFFMGK